ncbi:MAG: SsrA-binding protein, partial [Anaerolineaceae bacterium]|nr:SsrA-binding protein [Anaerolineaceae bacterium]
MSIKIIASNRKANFEFHLMERFEAGIALQGSEIKSIRAGQVSLGEAYVQLDAHNAWLVGAHVAPYDPASRQNHDPTRTRRLL